MHFIRASRRLARTSPFEACSTPRGRCADQGLAPADVEFNPLHLLSPTDAIDVSVPSVLDEVALSDDAVGAEEFAEIVEGAHSGWSLESPHPNPISTLSRSSSAAFRARSNSPSPPRSPGSLVGGGGALPGLSAQQPRLASPGASSYSFSSIGTPGNSPPITPLQSEARIKEAAELAPHTCEKTNAETCLPDVVFSDQFAHTSRTLMLKKGTLLAHSLADDKRRRKTTDGKNALQHDIKKRQ